MQDKICQMLLAPGQRYVQGLPFGRFPSVLIQQQCQKFHFITILSDDFVQKDVHLFESQLQHAWDGRSAITLQVCRFSYGALTYPIVSTYPAHAYLRIYTFLYVLVQQQVKSTKSVITPAHVQFVLNITLPESAFLLPYSDKLFQEKQFLILFSSWCVLNSCTDRAL